jgi:hypothetical protein
LVNSFLEYPGASVYYSTDPDDIRVAGIMDQQEDYWTRIHEGFVSNAHNDFTCFVIHNEDHDAHRESSQHYIGHYLSQLPEGVVAATLEEVRQWLELRYPHGQHPSQLLELADPLTCHDAVAAKRHKGSPPAHWGQTDGHNPGVLCYYGADARWMAGEGEQTPAQYIDYGATVGFAETGTSPKKPIPILTDWQEAVELTPEGEVLSVSFTADLEFSKLPLIWWDRPELAGDACTTRAVICYVDVVKGRNECTVMMKQP